MHSLLQDEHTAAAPAMPFDQGIFTTCQQLASTSDMAGYHQASHTTCMRVAMHWVKDFAADVNCMSGCTLLQLLVEHSICMPP